jgi:hypothetical protein
VIRVEYDLRQFKDSLEKAAMESIVAQAKQKVGSVRCATHGQSPTVRVEGRALNRLTFDVQGCCQTVIDQVRSRLG